MGIVKRQAIKATIVSYAGAFLGYFNQVILFVQFLAPAQIGLIRLIVDFATVASQVTLLGIPSVILKYFPFFKDRDKKHNNILSFSILIGLLGFTLVTIILFAFKGVFVKIYEERSEEFINYYHLVIPLLFYFTFFNILDAYSRSLMRITAPSILRDIFSRVLVAAVVIIFYFKLIDFSWMLSLYALSFIIPVIALAYYIKRLGHWFLGVDFSFFTKELKKNISSFAGFSLLGTASSTLVWRIDVLMIAPLLGLTETGIYGIASYIGSVIEIPGRSLSQISMPVIADAWKNNDLSKIADMYSRTALNQLIITGLIFLLIWCGIDDIIDIFLKPEYQEGKYVVLFIALGKLVNLASGVNGEIIMTSKYYRHNIIMIIILMIATIGFNIVFIPTFGITGAAFATFLSLTIFNLAKFVFVWIKLKIQPFGVKHFLSTLIIALFVLINAYTPKMGNSMADLLLRCSVVSLLYLITIYHIKLSNDINDYIDMGINKLRKIFK